MLFGIWFLGAVVTYFLDEMSRKGDCIDKEGLFKGLVWCSTDNWERDSGWTKGVISGLRWPLFLFEGKKSDIRTLADLLAKSSNPMNEAEAQEFGAALGSFSKKVHSYPASDIKYLEDFGSSYIRYSVSILMDFRLSIKKASHEQRQPTLDMSTRTASLEKDLLKYPGMASHIKEYKAALGTQFSKYLNMDFKTVDSEIIDMALILTKPRIEADLLNMISTYKQIFGHNPMVVGLEGNQRSLDSGGSYSRRSTYPRVFS